MLYVNGRRQHRPGLQHRPEAEADLLSRFEVLLGDPILDANRRLAATTAE